jgi:(2Fe-2S) ferredoxin
MPLPKRHILVCTNARPAESGKPSCSARGAEALLAALKDAVKTAGLKDTVWVTKSGCLKHCSRGATLMVWPEGILLGGATGTDVKEIVETCGRDGTPVARLRMPDMPWE